MKGIIIYSSKTGNTKAMAEYLYENLKKDYDMTIRNYEEKYDLDDYDFVLLGSWINIGTLEKNILGLIEKVNTKIGLFATIGADPNSEHGIEALENLNKLIGSKDSLGSYICRGVVAKSLIDRLDLIPDSVLSKSVKEQMREASLNSRKATQNELAEAYKYFYNNLKK